MMLGKTKKTILAIEIVFLIILSGFVFSIITGNAKNTNPIAKVSADLTTGSTPLTVTFKGTGSDRDGAVVSYYWDFGDGTTSYLNSPTHVYKKSGIYTATLTVTDNDGAIARNKITINAENINSEINPTYYADIDWTPTYPDVGETVVFTAHGVIMGEYWNFGDGASGHGSRVSHVYNKKGTFTVTLTGTTWDPSSQETEYVHETEYIKVGASPFPVFSWSPLDPLPGEKITLDASASNDVNGKIVKYNWSYTDSTNPNSRIELGDKDIITYTFKNQGSYNVKLAVTDDDNNTNENTQTIVVSILRIDKVTGGYRNLDIKITNRGNITAENIRWTVSARRNLIIFIPTWRIFEKTGSIGSLGSGQSVSVDMGRIRRAFGWISLTVTIEGSNAEKITKNYFGFMFSKFIRIRS